jgi:non-specific serine/threonine protein kinase
VFRRLSVFAGGATTDAVAAVCGAALGSLADLVRASLGQRMDGHEPRVAMLETVREYASELLQESGEAAAVRRAHAEHHLALVSAAARELTGPAQAAWLARLPREHDNLRAALSWASGGGDAAIGLLIATRASGYWATAGHRREGLGWLDRLLAAAEDVDPATRAGALSAAGGLAWLLGDAAAAEARYRPALELFRRAGDEAGLAGAVTGLASVAALRGEFARAAELHREGLLRYRSQNHRFGVAASLRSLGMMQHRLGSDQVALDHCRQAMAIFQELEDWQGIAYSLNDLADLSLAAGDHVEARRYVEESIGLCRELGAKGQLARGLRTLGALALAAGDAAGARHCEDEAQAIRQALATR